jgi:hypothetical protein
MAIAFRGSASGTVINGGTVSIDLTAITGLAQDDVVCIYTISSAGTLADPSGWTPIQSDTSVNATAYQAGAWYKVMTASPDTSVSFWDTGGTGDSGTALAFAFSGVDTSTPMDTTATEAEGSNLPGGAGCPAIVPASDDCMIVVFMGASNLDATPGTLSNYTQPTTFHATSNDTSDTSSSGAYRLLSGGAGASEDPGAWTTWGGAGDTYGVTIALRPAAATGQPAVKRIGGVKFVGNRAGQNTNLWRRAADLLLPNPSIIRV